MRYAEHKCYCFETEAHWAAGTRNQVEITKDGAIQPKPQPVQSHANPQPDTPSDPVPSFVTPVLVSPDGAVRGWMRADLEVTLEDESTIEVGVQTLSGFDNDLTPFPWSSARVFTFRCGEAPTARKLRIPLHELDATRLRLGLRFHVHGKKIPTVQSLRVLYPNLSYVRYLPAIYQDQDAAGKPIRRILSILESEFGDLEAQLLDLPTRIDPKTAPNEWLPFLLSWLGLPPAPELSHERRRVLLLSAPELLTWRGTQRALEILLEVLTGDEFLITDRSAGQVPWTLTNSKSQTYLPRLGCDTLITSWPQSGFRLSCESRLGEQALGYAPLDPVKLFASRGPEIDVSVAATMENKRLEPLLRRYLPYFIPAHCIYRLLFVPRTELQHRILKFGDSLPTEDMDSPRLGLDTRAGGFKPSRGSTEGIILGRSRFDADGPNFC